MRYAVLINTNTSATQLKRTVNKLNNGDFDFYINVDKSLNIAHYSQVLALKNAYPITNRVHSNTGGFSALKATLNGVKEILAAENDYDFITLLNGRDYPIKSAAEIAAFFKLNHGKQFIKYNADWHDRHYDYTAKYHLIDSSFPGKRMAEKLMNLFLGQPKAPKNLTIVGQSSHWIITPDCARYVLQYIRRYKFEHFLRYTKNADLFVFQSIIMHSSFKGGVVNNDYRYNEETKGSGRSKVLTVKDFDKIIASDRLFAGRFDIREDEKILTMIDQANANPKGETSPI